MTHTTGRRTTLHGGRERDYETTHARVPDAVAAALRDAGVLQWRIWRDGRLLFHAVETTGTYEAMESVLLARGPVDEEWDARIRDLLDSGPDSDEILPLVWSLDGQPLSRG